MVDIDERFDVDDSFPARDDEFGEVFEEWCKHPSHNEETLGNKENEYWQDGVTHRCEIHRTEFTMSKVHVGDGELYVSMARPQDGRVKTRLLSENVDEINVTNGFLEVTKESGESLELKPFKEF